MPLDAYRKKRDAARTPEPVPAASAETAPVAAGELPIFVIQEHHARSLHWDFRLERDGVFVSWAVPKGLPMAPGVNHLAVHVEDHPLEYGSFEGQIPDHEYGAGGVTIWDRGTYESDELDRPRGEGHPPRRACRGPLRPVPDQRRPELDDSPHRSRPRRAGSRCPSWSARCSPTPGPLPTGDGWAYEFKWDGVRAIVYVDGGRIRTLSRTDRDVTTAYPELRGLGEALGSLQTILDGEIVALDDKGRPSFEALQPRMNTAEPNRVRRLVDSIPVTYMIFDLLHLDGHSALDAPLQRAPPAPRGPEARRAAFGDAPVLRPARVQRSSSRPATPGSRASWRSDSTASTAPAGGTRAG